ncbi:MAG: diaminopimelate epimerase [Desulfovibrio sp.]|jgi:diaminopimelate epimerase|nr:diaminopimelate epimerase [Desulfovibrio sp.]
MRNGLRFSKMQGAGNDYVYVNCFEERVDNPETLAPRISDRHFGVGSDGLVLILPSGTADLRMRMFNADGSEAQMCGNAVRCVGKYARDRGLVAKDVVRVETAAGIKIVRLRKEGGEVTGATVDMGEPELRAGRIPVAAPGIPADGRVIGLPLEVDGRAYAVTAVSMGNPHAVVFADSVDALDLARTGPLFEHHPYFPQRINTEFVEIVSSAKIRIRVWERGAGETLACGTGACAAVVAAVLNGRTCRETEVELKGGPLHINWDESDGCVHMTGDAADVFDGVYFMV